ncbi:Mpp10 protein [Gloeophyllum trabeum ATCC 11539]|uniref:U3 small nucleolar ribonucleoprotein protein MPP10 n=1 Tax=Gloeophyllum trabeum (strain ATCC 11539 / FP-39264 / Madison 617) TaxID=670483 RepID=S7S0B6_GLOTA|nr:Mpp10 protein [Gloeophyllum trabeum ATCC 11539]EPQ60790.1 Mpp10 protein [Gloeophyllum trabeum ATCC 11539]
MADAATFDDALEPLSRLSVLVAEHPESFASGSKDIREAALHATKCVFDLALKTETPSQKYVGQLLSSLTPDHAPQTRSQARANGKRKRSPSPSLPQKGAPQTTPLSSLFIEEMDDDQIWAQLELRAKHVCETLEEALEGTGEPEDSGDEGYEESDDGEAAGGSEDDDESLELQASDEDVSDKDEDDDEDEDEDEEGSLDEEAMEDGTTALRDPSDDEDVEDEEEYLSLDEVPPRKDKASALKPPKPKVGGHPELDDGFFDLAAFNAEVEEAEARSVSRGTLGGGDDEDDDGDESFDMFAPVDDLQVEEEEAVENAGGEAYYQDFFEPPAKVKTKRNPSLPEKKTTKVRFHDEVRVKKIKAKGKGLPVSFMDDVPTDLSSAYEYGEELSDEEDDAGGFDLGEEESEEDGVDNPSDEEMEGDSDDELDTRDTMERFKDDLFAEEEETPQSDLSTHEKRMAALREQITALEAENISKKDWTLMGEATARSRPQNSLLEEDLEFDRVMKVVPVVTEESVQNLEDRIKARILEGNFDDVVRKRPLDDKPFLPSRFFELQDTKSKQSLAEIYEDEYTAARTGGVAGEDRDGKLQAEHQEIENQWESICAKLDALCNVHFTPKQPKATISTVSNVSAATLESALPTSKATTTMLAPEEVYAPSTSAPRSSSELTPAEKRALHNKQKKKRRKARDLLDKTVDKVARVRGIKGVKKQKEEALNSVVKSGKGVTVIGKKTDQNAKKGRSKG